MIYSRIDFIVTLNVFSHEECCSVLAGCAGWRECSCPALSAGICKVVNECKACISCLPRCIRKGGCWGRARVSPPASSGPGS